MKAPAAQDGPAAYQVVGGVKYPLASTRTGCESNSPEMDSETRIQVLRDAQSRNLDNAGNRDQGLQVPGVRSCAFLLFKGLGIRGG